MAGKKILKMFHWNTDFDWDEHVGRKNTFKPVNGRLSVDYRFLDKFTTGVQYIRSRRNSSTLENSRVNIKGNTTGMLDSIIQTQGRYKSVSDYNSLNYHAIYTIDTSGVKLSFDADYFNYITDSQNIFATNNFYSEGSFIPGSYVSAKNLGSR